MKETNFIWSGLNAAKAQENSQWLHAIPVSSLGTKLNAEQLRIGITLRIDVDAGNLSNPQACTVCLAQSTK